MLSYIQASHPGRPQKRSVDREIFRALPSGGRRIYMRLGVYKYGVKDAVRCVEFFFKAMYHIGRRYFIKQKLLFVF
jgi:hypothetical protein